MSQEYTLALETVTDWKRTRRGVELAVDAEFARFDFIRDDILRIKISQGGTFDASPTFAIVSDEFGAPAFTVRKTAKALTLRTSALTLKISLAPFRFDVSRADGTPVIRSVPSEGYRFLNDRWQVRRRKTSADTILGLGEKTLPYNHNGKTLEMWNTDILAPAVDGSVRSRSDDDPEHNPISDRFDPYYISINLLYHMPAGAPGLAGASYFDCGYKMHFDFSHKGWYEVAAEGGQLTEYVFAGPTMRHILRQYTELTGRMQPPPRWALGHHQCRWHDYTETTWLQLAAEYRRRKIPCDVLWLDIHYMDEYRVFTWDSKKFPHIGKALATLRAQGLRAITIIDPGVKYDPGYPVFDEGSERNLFCKCDNGQTYIGQVWPGRTAFPDFVKEETRRWWGRLNAEHVRSGLAGIWNDMNEPATGAVPPFAMRFDRDGANHPHERYHNQYAMLMAMGTTMGLREAMPNLRTFVLSRAGFAGIQRYAANWTGDNVSKWEHLALSVTMNGNLGLSGQPFVGSDIGGFCGDTTEELLIRWYQYGAFQPFMRNHSVVGARDQYPWSFGRTAERLIRAAVELRYRLLPYTYSAFMDAAETGEPIQRPLGLDWQDDPTALTNGTEYLFGRDILVAPVVRQGETTRTLYLPKGDWCCFHTGEAIRGGRSITVDAPLDRIPLFVRAGAIIPQAKVVQSTDDIHLPETELHVYVPPRNGTTTGMLHEDDGLTDGHTRGEFLRTDLTVTRKGNKLTIAGQTSGDGFGEFARKTFRLVFHGATIKDRVIRNTGQDFQETVTL